MESLNNILKKSLNKEFLSAIISNPREKGGIVKIKIRPVEHKDNILYQCEEHRNNQVFHHNLNEEEAAGYIENAMQEFKQMQLETRKFRYQVLVSKKGKMTIQRRLQTGRFKEIDLSHNRKKHYILEEGKAVPFLQDLGVMTKEGEIVRTKFDKFRQINRFIEMIDDAISEGKKVAFLYNTYGIDKQLHPRKDTKYIVNPYQMVANEGKYYLICNYDKYDNLSNYRIDRMTEIEILDEKVKDKSLVKGMEHGLNLPQHMAEHLYMFSDPAATIVLKVQKGNMGDIVDWFDKNFEVLSPKFVQNNYPDNFNPETDANKAFIRVTCSQNAMFHWAMQYGTSVEVIEPADLRERIRDAVNEMAERYK